LLRSVELTLNNRLNFMTVESNNNEGALFGQVSEKICPNCKKWTHWKLQAEDVCEHCGQLLSTYKQEKEGRAERIKSTPMGLFSIAETDGVVLVSAKRIANFGYVIFTAVVGFVIWFITVVVA
jgi:hypothetical protein